MRVIWCKKKKLFILMISICLISCKDTVSQDNDTDFFQQLDDTLHAEIIPEIDEVSVDESAVDHSDTVIQDIEAITDTTDETPDIDTYKPKYTNIACGNIYTCAIKEDGSLWCWGQYGNGVIENPYPKKIPYVNNAAKLSAGYDYTCFTDTDKNAWCWGTNYDGQLGLGEISHSLYPMKIEMLSNIESIAVNEKHTCASDSVGSVWCWGYNGNWESGQEDTTKKYYLPQTVALTEKAISVAIEFDASYALTNKGELYSWGYVPIKTEKATPIPILVPSVKDIKMIEGKYHNACFVKNDGTLWCRGWNQNKQLGQGEDNTKSSTEPVQVQGITDVKTVSIGYQHLCALKTDGTVWCWGYNRSGELGRGFIEEKSFGVPQPVVDISDVAEVSVGSGQSCALKTDGTVWCWGENGYGKLGVGDISNSPAPVQVVN